MNSVPFKCHIDTSNPACALGEKLKVPVYAFLREPLERVYGKAFYLALEQAAALHEAPAHSKQKK